MLSRRREGSSWIASIHRRHASLWSFHSNARSPCRRNRRVSFFRYRMVGSLLTTPMSIFPYLLIHVGGDPAQLSDVRCFPRSILSSSRVDLPTFPWTSPPFTCFHMAFMHAFSRLITCVSPPLGSLVVVHRRGGVEVHPSHVTSE